jgi:hypothetical protein
MTKFKLLFLFKLILILSACGSIKEGFNTKKNNDEFLVEKKSPLIMPPDYNELPIPKEGLVQKNKNKTEIKSLITKTENATIDDNNSNKVNKTFEETLLEKIKNN